MRLAPITAVLLLVASSLTVREVAAQGVASKYANDLAQCLVKSTTSTDKTVLVKWIFTTMALHPTVEPMAAVTDSERTQINQTMAGIVQRLLTVACKAEAQLAIKHEGTGALQASFGVLGQVAMSELFADPSVDAGASAFAQYLDEDELVRALTPPGSE